VVALKHSEGIKHTVLFQEQKLTINDKHKSLTIHALSLSLSSVSLYSLHQQLVSEPRSSENRSVLEDIRIFKVVKNKF
jgi:hypothetical protein